jgi:hypothetical protein
MYSVVVYLGLLELIILSQFLDDRGLGLKIVQKPAGRKTIYWLKFSIFALLPLITRPTGALLDWFADSPSVYIFYFIHS